MLRHRRFRVALLSGALLGPVLAAQPTWAQSSLGMTNSDEAIRQYEQGTLETLRARCAHQRSEPLRNRAEFSGVTNGVVSVQATSGPTARYALLAYDKDKRIFQFVDGQALGRNARLVLPLVLPRDYANCRIVRNAQAQEFLEVHLIARNEVSTAEAMQRLYDEVTIAAQTLTPSSASDPGASPTPLCANAPAAGTGQSQLHMRVAGAPLALAFCSDAVMYIGERMEVLMRKVFGR